MFKSVIVIWIIISGSMCVWSGDVFAAHPLITDDAATVGKGKFQVEVGSEFGFDKRKEEDAKIKERNIEITTTLTWGIMDNVDVVLGLPYQWVKVEKDGIVDSDENGISDISIELKWRFLEREGLGLGLKPGITLPTGDKEKGFGTGKSTYSIFFITTKEMNPWGFHINLGYIRNENDIDERENLWHASVAGEVMATERLKLVGNIGIEKNPDKTSDINPAFILGGLIYSLSENIDLDFGIKGGLNKPETDYSFLVGICMNF